MGGYASLVVSEQVEIKALFLLAPALYLKGYEKQQFTSKTKNIEIVHGWLDETVPVEHSIKFAKASNATLHIINSDHRLRNAHDVIEQMFGQFLSNVASG
jgi:predicted esterase